MAERPVAGRAGPPAYVFFDAGNTLITSHLRIDTVYAAALRRHGADLPEGDAARELLGPVISGVWRSINDELVPGENRYAQGAGHTFWRRFVAEIARRARLTLDEDAAFEELYAYYARAEAWDVYPDVVESLDALHEGGVRMGIISNWDTRLPALLETLGLLERFEPVVVSALVGIEKPSSAIFRLAAERAGVDPADCVHLGDSEPLDVAGACDAGMTPLLVVRALAGKLASEATDTRERTTDADVVYDLRTLTGRFGVDT